MKKRKATIYDLMRMCDLQDNCAKCPIGEICCAGFAIRKENLDKANETILKWCDEHPIKTRQSEFLKLIPNAAISSTGAINILPCRIEKVAPNPFDCNHCKYSQVDDCEKAYWSEEIK